VERNFGEERTPQIFRFDNGIIRRWTLSLIFGNEQDVSGSLAIASSLFSSSLPVIKLTG
jgi:hypothetical protein